MKDPKLWIPVAIDKILEDKETKFAEDFFQAANMFITVKFGQNESLLCNPSCAVINLLSSIKRRAGFAHTNVTLDLSDETGNVLSYKIHVVVSVSHAHELY